jgi:DNA polymerase III epsilon subunit-like protein
MATPKNAPRGYFEYALAVDCETTGLCYKNYNNDENPVYNPTTGERHQALSWGVAVVRVEDFSIVEELYVEIKWNEDSLKQRLGNPEFGKSAEKIHGMTMEYLEENGVSEEEAVTLIGDLILRYFGPDNPIKLIGHNVHLFDLAFLRDMFKRHGIILSFGNRHYDSNSAALMTFGTWNSDDLFSMIGFEARGEHNALADIKMTVEACRIIQMIFKKALED